MAFNAFMHERNIYKNRPDFAQLALEFPEFRKYTIPDAKGKKFRVDFTNTEALRILTKILLKKDFNLDVELPEGFLIPTVPQRLNYILWLEDLLSATSQKKESISGIDIGTGVCAIFSILGAQKNGWKFIATESSDDTVLWAKKNIEANNLQDKIKIVKVNQGSSLDEILSSNKECFDFCMCNPPFFESSEEIRKKHQNTEKTIADVAQKEEIFVKGGESEFVKNILNDSLIYKDRISLFTTMFGKKKNFLQILDDLKGIEGAKFSKTEFCQGKTIRWGIAWTFNNSIQFKEEARKRTKTKKAKPPLEYQILLKDPKRKLNIIVKQTKIFLIDTQIPFKISKASGSFAEFLLKSDANTWVHQRRKRREIKRKEKESRNTDTAFETGGIKKQPQSENEVYEEPIFECSEKFNSLIKGNNSHETTYTCINNKTDIEIADQNEINDKTLSESTSVDLETLDNKRKEFSTEESPPAKKIKLEVQERIDSFHHEQNSSDIIKDGKLENSIKSETISENNRTIDAKSENEKNTSQTLIQEIKSEKSQSPSEGKDSKNEISSHTVGNPDQKSNSPNDNENYCSKDFDCQVGNILNCYLRFIKGKDKVYVKMDCPPNADRNVMYQVFQLIKNKIN